MEFVKKHFATWLRLEQFTMFLMTILPLLYWLSFWLLASKSPQPYVQVFKTSARNQFWVYANLTIINYVLARLSQPFFEHQKQYFSEKTGYFWFSLILYGFSKLMNSGNSLVFAIPVLLVQGAVNFQYSFAAQRQLNALKFKPLSIIRWVQFLGISFGTVLFCVALFYQRNPTSNIKLTYQQVRSIQEEISNARQVKSLYGIYLNLSNYGLQKLPTELLPWYEIEQLDLKNNQLTQFDVDLKQYPNLHYLSLRGNPIQNIPPDILQLDNCVDALRTFQSNLKK